MNDELRKSNPDVLINSQSLSYQDYKNVPWYRKSSINSFFIVLTILSGGFFPGTLLVCTFVLTGDIYYKHHDKDGNLNTWSWGNKVAAVMLLLITFIYLGYIFLH